MPSFTITQNVQYNGQNYAVNRTVNGNEHAGSAPVGGVAAANQGELTVRTDANTGTLTMDSGAHGIITGDRLDVYWSGGSRYGMTVGTVSGTTVPIDGGTGDDLPALNSDVFAAVPNVGTLSVVGNNATGMLAFSGLSGSDLPGWVVFTQADNTFIAAYDLTATEPNAEWDQGTNPFAGVTVGKIFLSHGNLSAKVMGAEILYS